MLALATILAAAMAQGAGIDSLADLDVVARGQLDQGTALLSSGNPADAVTYLRAAHELAPTSLPVALALARALAATDRPAEADALLATFPGEAEAVATRARAWESIEPSRALQLWRELRVLRPGDAAPHLAEARLLARNSPEAAVAAWRAYVAALGGGEPDGATLLALADAAPADAEALLREYAARFPTGGVLAEAEARLDRIQLQREASLAEIGTDEPLAAHQVALAENAAEALARGRGEDALQHARLLVASAPRSAAAHGVLADALRATDHLGEAEQEAIVARRLAPDDSAARARLGMLLHAAYGGRRDAEAVIELREAARLQPGDAPLHCALGEVEQALANWKEAVAATERCAATEGTWTPAARARLAALVREAPRVDDTRFVETIPAAAGEHARMAKALWARGRVADAEAALDAALGAAPGNIALLSLRARFLRESDRPAEALAVLRQVVAADPAQPAAWRSIGELAADAVERRRAWTQAAAHGDADAAYLLARLAADGGDWTEARAQLAAYAARASPYSSYREAAAVLRGEADRRYWGLRGGVAAVLVLGASAPAFVYARRRTAATLRELLDRAPTAWHDAARILSAIRHEVLKHNTTVLPDVADAVERGDLAPWTELRLRLPELVEKLEAYLDALEALGRQHGVRADLRHRDPVLAPAWRALHTLARRTHPSAHELRTASRLVNLDAYDALGRLVREICTLPVDAHLVRAAWAGVRGEPAFAGQPLPEVEVAEVPNLAVRMFRGDMVDLLSNLLRNAAAAGAETMRVDLAEAEDPITGHPLVEIRCWDDAPGELTTEMLRGRALGRGLGLAVDIVHRHGGSVRVAPGRGGKAVIVQFPAIEADGEGTA